MTHPFALPGPTSIFHIASILKSERHINQVKEYDETNDIFRNAISSSGQQASEGVLYGRCDCSNGLWKAQNASALLKLDTLSEQLSLIAGKESILDDLLLTSITKILPVFPVVTVSESMGREQPPDTFWQYYTMKDYDSTPHSPLPKIVRLVHYGLASMSRAVPVPIRQSIIRAVREELDDTLQPSRQNSLSTVQLLVSLFISLDLHHDNPTESRSLLWQRVGTGIRGAFDMGIHRRVSNNIIPCGQVHRRRRVWGSCIIADRWLALQYGQPLTIDLDDCDAQLPFWWPDHVPDMEDISALPIVHKVVPSFRFLSELTSLSILLGRAYSLTSSTLRLAKSQDLGFYSLQNDMDVWKVHLPNTWQYSPVLEIPAMEHLMQLFLVALEYTFLKPFFPANIPWLPAHIAFRPTVGSIERLVERAIRSLSWLSSEEGAFYLDVCQMTVYPAFLCMVIIATDVTHKSDLALASALLTGQEVFTCWSEVEGPSGKWGSRQQILGAINLLGGSSV
uniref:Xylanolytic transcriptional activator regulatory domain-containing protein n=1 Tax=Kwoniella pini CBS 10737 TaxID=1296096 RepID=A0A1B9HSK0_9TREE|nr:uncharacterized protein I206_07732 [Kwoniella pini CBS 10737]OCF46255.1 hypothetical protein I206_07732 [Kwoniella pini CBS 10737]